MRPNDDSHSIPGHATLAEENGNQKQSLVDLLVPVLMAVLRVYEEKKGVIEFLWVIANHRRASRDGIPAKEGE